MDVTSNRSRSTRRRAATAAVCTALVTVVGGALLATPATASAASTGECAIIQLVSTDGSGVAEAPSGGVSPSLLHCGVSVGLGGMRPPSTTTASPAPTPRTTAATSTQLSNVTITRSIDSVYPVKDGYLDTVKFAVSATNAAGDLVPVQGTAILSRGTTPVKSWTLDASNTVLSWNGRVAGRIRAGVYTLLVSAWSPDGSTRTMENRIRVLSKHVEQRAMTVDSIMHGNDTQAEMPEHVMEAYAKGPVTVRVRTVAKVRGAAELVYSNDGVVRSIRLLDGVHTTKPLIVPKGSERVSITHRWAKGTARLQSAKAIWTYYALVK